MKMKASWKVCTLFGVPVRIHATFPLLLLWLAAIDFAGGGDWRKVVGGATFTLAIFGLVVLHELGHALVAKKFGVRTSDITLFPLGGVARLEKIPRRPAHELWISLAGPAVNVVLAALLFSIVAIQGGLADETVHVMDQGFLSRLAWANVAMALFNLLPAFPMDGGRVLRAMLALQIDSVRATDIAVLVGKGFAILLGIAGVAVNPLLVMIAVFVWFGAEQESGTTRLRSALEGVPVEDVMMTEFHVLVPDDPLQYAVDLALAGGQQHFPVVADGTVVGMLAWHELLAGLSKSGATARVGDAMSRQVRTLHENDLVERVVDAETNGRLRAMPVMREGRIVGLFTLENLTESIALRSAATRARRPQPLALRSISHGNWCAPNHKPGEA